MSCSLPIGASDVSAEEEWAVEVAVVKEDLVVEAANAEAVVAAEVSVGTGCRATDLALLRVQYLYATPIVA